MTLVVDDSPDVWRGDLPNLCLVRRFVGDVVDDGLQQLCSKLLAIHSRYFAAFGASSTAFSLDDSAPPPPDIRHILGEMRGGALSGCNIALTGVVADQTEETLAQQPLAILVRLHGGTVTTGIDEATHLVARQKEGWKQSHKIRRAAQRSQVAASLARRPAARSTGTCAALPLPACPALCARPRACSRSWCDSERGRFVWSVWRRRQSVHGVQEQKSVQLRRGGFGGRSPEFVSFPD